MKNDNDDDDKASTLDLMALDVVASGKALRGNTSVPCCARIAGSTHH